MKLITPTIKPTIKQDQAWGKLQDKETIFIVFGGGAGGGKSWLGSEWLLTSAYFYPGLRAFIGREELKRLMNSTFITFQKVCSFHNIPKSDWILNGQYNYIDFRNGSRIDLLDLKYQPSDPDYDRFGSQEYTYGWIEEASEIDFKAFDVLKTRIGRHLHLAPKMLITCNPRKNWLYQIVYKSFKEKVLPKEYTFIQSLYGDNPWTAKDYSKVLSQITEKATKERLMFGNWEYEEDPNTLMNYEAILDLFTNTIELDDKRYIVADIARYGSDRIVISYWEGLVWKEVFIYQKKGIDETERIIRTLAQEKRVPFSQILVDEEGIGGGIVDVMRGIKGFVGNSSPIEDPIRGKLNYLNLKAQCNYLLAEKVNNHQIAVIIEGQDIRNQLIEELEQIKAKDSDKDIKLQIESKDKIKELLGRSPDLGDVMVMRMFFELKKTGSGNPFSGEKIDTFI